jgi:GxxExxY protein
MTHDNPGTSPHADLTRSILGVAFHVQDVLGLGLLEKPYQLCLAHALRGKGHHVMTEASLEIAFEGLLVPDAYRLDLLVDDAVIVEVKAIDQLNDWHEAQLLTYLRLSGKQIGLLLNFWARPLKNRGIRRVILTANEGRGSVPPLAVRHRPILPRAQEG